MTLDFLLLHIKLIAVNDQTLQQICVELSRVLTGQKFGKIFPLARFQMAVDFRLPDSQFLFFSFEPNAPRIYLVRRRLRDLEKQAVNPAPFVLFLRKRLAGAVLQKIEKIADERVLRFTFKARDELGQTTDYALIAQLTGRSANFFLLDENDFVLDSLRETFGDGQEIGGRYAPPTRPEKRQPTIEQVFSQEKFQTLSESLDHFHLEKEAERHFQARVKSAESKLQQEITKREKLLKKLQADLKNHGDAERWKRFGDLILANLATARRENDQVFVTDFYDENLPEIEIAADENISLTETAEKFFRRYTKARNAGAEISKRSEVLSKELENLGRQKTRLEAAVNERDETAISEFIGEKPENLPLRGKGKQAETAAGARRFLSTEGFEILVGKGAKDNDFLTFRVAKSLDLWLHAADYPGSHVVVKNPNRQEIPPKTLLQAAQIAAFYSQARTQAKVAVHFTQKKFVNKPRGANPGLVSLASFKTVLVEPKIEAITENG